MTDKVCPFVYEKNNRRLTVVSECSFHTLIHELLENLNLQEIFIKAPVYRGKVVDYNIKQLPRISKIYVDKEAYVYLGPISCLIETFASVLRTIDLYYEDWLPDGVYFPILRYLKLTKSSQFYYRIINSENPQGLYPKLTYVDVPHFDPFCLHSDGYNQFFFNVYRNQKQEMAALVFYFCVKPKVGKDIAKILVNYIMSIPNVFWKLSLKDLQSHKIDLIKHITYFEEEVSRQTKRIREENPDKFPSFEDNALQLLKKYKIMVTDDE